MTGTLTYSRRVSAMHALRPTSNRHPSFRAGRRDPWRRRWGGWSDKETPPSRWLAARARPMEVVHMSLPAIFLATKGRSGEWLDAHPLVALGIVIACVLVGGWLA